MYRKQERENENKGKDKESINQRKLRTGIKAKYT
jgi:hypothetical protein